MIHVVIDRDGTRTEFPEHEALWLKARSTIVECKVAHFSNFDKHEFFDMTEYVIYHPGSRGGRMISMDDVRERLKEMPHLHD